MPGRPSADSRCAFVCFEDHEDAVESSGSGTIVGEVRLGTIVCAVNANFNGVHH